MKRLALVVLIVCALMSVQNTDIAALTDGEGDIIIKLKPGTPPNYINSLCQEYDATKVDSIMSLEIYLLHVNQDASKKTIEIHNDTAVQYAQQNCLAKISSCELWNEPNDQKYDPVFPGGRQWNLGLMSFPAAWECSHGEGVVVGIIDEGIKLNHEDLENSVHLNSDEYFAEGGWPNDIDDDNNGFVDDAIGWDYNENLPLGDCIPGCFACDGSDNHGTHVAGILAATTHNVDGVASGGWGHRSYGTSFIPVKFADWPYSYEWQVYKSLEYIINHREVDIILINAGKDDEPTYPWHDLITDAYNSGILVVAPVGNSEPQIQIPARYEEVIAVGATKRMKSARKYPRFFPLRVKLSICVLLDHIFTRHIQMIMEIRMSLHTVMTTAVREVLALLHHTSQLLEPYA